MEVLAHSPSLSYFTSPPPSLPQRLDTSLSLPPSPTPAPQVVGVLGRREHGVVESREEEDKEGGGEGGLEQEREEEDWMEYGQQEQGTRWGRGERAGVS